MTATKTPQSEIIKALGIPPGKAKQLREKHGLVRDIDWFKDGATIYWTSEAAAKAGFAHEQTEPVIEPVPPSAEVEFIAVRGLNLARNENFVYADLNGTRIAVLAGRKFAKRLAGKPFNVKVDRSGPETTYHFLP